MPRGGIAKSMRFATIVWLAVMAAGCGGGGSGGDASQGPATHAPVAVDQTVRGVEDEALALTLLGSDKGGGPLSFRIVTPCTYGTLSGTPPELIYHPDPDFAGTDTFTFEVDDGTWVSAPAVVSILVESRNDLPVVEQVVVTEQQLGKVFITCRLGDPDGDPCSLVVEYRRGSTGAAWQPATVIGDLTGLLPGESYSIVWDVLADEADCEAGTYQVRLTPRDAAGDGQAAAFSVLADGCDSGDGEEPDTRVPVAVGMTLSGVEDEPLPITLEGVDDPDGHLVFSIVTPCSHGTLSGTPPDLIYHPDPDFADTDTFTFEVDDGTSVSDPALVSIRVESRNDLPVVEQVVVAEQQLGKIVVTCTLRDPDDEPCSLVVEYRGGSAGAEWQPATVIGDLTGLLPGEPYSIVWDVEADEAEPEAIPYQVRLTPWDAEGEGQAGETEVLAGQIVRPLLFVDDDAPEGGDGLAWATAFRHPQEAVDARELGARVWVARGTYTVPGGDETGSVLVMKENVDLYGGFTGTEANLAERDVDANATVLDGRGTAHHVVVGADAARLDGFTITRGNARGIADPRRPQNNAASANGAGMYNVDCSPVVANCTFLDNSAAGMGGGMHTANGAPQVVDCVFEGNTSVCDGAGMSNVGSSPVVTGTTFRNNIVPEWRGGGMSNRDESSPTVTDCVFIGNSAGSGGGVSNFQSSSPVIEACVFTDNLGAMGGAVNNMFGSAAQIRNCVFTENASDWRTEGTLATFATCWPW